METYPIVQFPDKVIELRKKFPELLERSLNKKLPQKPTCPSQPQEPTFQFFYLVFIAFSLAALMFFVTKDSSVANPTFLFGLLAYPIYYFIAKGNYTTELENYNKQYQVFLQSGREYEFQKAKFEEEKKQLQENLKNQDWMNSEFKKRIARGLKPLKTASIAYPNPKEGRAERVFLEYLNKVFEGEIQIEKVTELFSMSKNNSTSQYDDYQYDYYSYSSRKRAYCPDFIYCHKETSLTIDIEIDEPYNRKGEPIHTQYNEFDQKRNKYFCDLQWFVIRFSERQVLMEPESCCLDIANLIFDVIGDERYFSRISSSKPVRRDRTWSYSEAIDLWKQKKRNSYEEFNEKFLKVDTNLISNPLKCNDRKYLFTKQFEFTESAIIDGRVLDKGTFNGYKILKGRIRLDVNWNDGVTQYYVSQLDDDNIIFVEAHTGTQYKFERAL